MNTKSIVSNPFEMDVAGKGFVGVPLSEEIHKYLIVERGVVGSVGP